MITESGMDLRDHFRLHIFEPAPEKDWKGLSKLRSTDYVLNVDGIVSNASDLVKADHPDSEYNPQRKSHSQGINISSATLLRVVQ